ncbi:hypothetical protein IWZ00DRAFT_70348 [Phyllosticta capitalensis]
MWLRLGDGLLPLLSLFGDGDDHGRRRRRRRRRRLVLMWRRAVKTATFLPREKGEPRARQRGAGEPGTANRHCGLTRRLRWPCSRPPPTPAHYPNPVKHQLSPPVGPVMSAIVSHPLVQTAVVEAKLSALAVISRKHCPRPLVLLSTVDPGCTTLLSTAR